MERTILLRDLKFLMNIDLKIILLNHQNNFIGTLKIIAIANAELQKMLIF